MLPVGVQKNLAGFPGKTVLGSAAAGSGVGMQLKRTPLGGAAAAGSSRQGRPRRGGAAVETAAPLVQGLGSLNIYKYGLRLHWLVELVTWNQFLGSIT
jgi:hypothetical protein